MEPSPPFPSPASSPSASPLLRLENISLSFRGVRAISDISFQVERGEICGLIGPNGAGKSSLLNVINGVYTPQHGAVTFEGVRRGHMHPRRAAQAGIARTFQNIALFRGMTVVQNLMAGGHIGRRAGLLRQLAGTPLARREEAAAHARAEEVMRFLHIQRHRDDEVGRLPYGLQKRVELGRALVSRPKLLLLDEPMAGMTFAEKEEMGTFILDVNDALHTTVVLIEHDMGVVMELCDHLVVLDYGRKIADGPPAEIRESREVVDAYLGVAA